MRRVHTAVFFIYIANFKAVVFFHPRLNQLSGIVSRTIVYNQPNEIFTVLPAHGFICSRQRMRSVIGRREHC